jgi:uncharacterized membrane protein
MNEYSNAPPPPPPMPPHTYGSPGAGGPVSENRQVFLVLAYLWLLALIPFLMEKNDREVQWHAKHGLVLTLAEIVIWILLTVINTVLSSTAVLAPIACLGCFVMLVPMIGFLVVRVMCIMKAFKGERFLVPGISQFADQF